MSLSLLRKRIDQIDARLIRLLSQRARLAVSAGKIKKACGVSVFDAKREESVLRMLGRKNRGPLPQSSIRKIFSEILRQMRQLEKSV